jgi:hypothetical protein
MAKKMTYAKRVQWEKTPVVDGVQYRAADVGLAVNPCPECAAFNNDTLCNALPTCTKGGGRIDGLNVRYVACGKAAGSEVRGQGSEVRGQGSEVRKAVGA